MGTKGKVRKGKNDGSYGLRVVRGRQVYYYADITDVSLDAVSFRRSGTVKSVRIEFQSHRPLQLIALNSHHKLYEDLHRSWRAAAG